MCKDRVRSRILKEFTTIIIMKTESGAGYSKHLTFSYVVNFFPNIINEGKEEMLPVSEYRIQATSKVKKINTKSSLVPSVESNSAWSVDCITTHWHPILSSYIYIIGPTVTTYDNHKFFLKYIFLGQNLELELYEIQPRRNFREGISAQ